MLNSLRFLSSSLRYPQAARFGFLVSGLAIERRRRRLAQFWDPHLEQSKACQRSWLESWRPDGRLAVLGAGRLFDVATEDLCKHFSEISLFDADPQCLRYWKREYKNLRSDAVFFNHISDITQVLEQRQSSLRTFLRRSPEWNQALEFLRSLAASADSPESEFLLHGEYDAILSINLLSQLPVYWQHIAEIELVRIFGKKHVAAREDEWLEALIPSARALINQHLRDLARSRAKSILLISDLRYEHYYRDQQGGDVIEQIDALYGVELTNHSQLQKLFPEFDSQLCAQWDWHIAPLGRVRNSIGEKHRVASIIFSAKR